ncbi:hypothetical protein J2Y45_005212 [Dyadobacter sp. BE34]|uniref:Uncharacterized protein n=1 Tax=Dyadobacter fermentans TaxID=94254 RepID=A0ABU1R4W4_9BACT|nr:MULTISPECIES: hypothetical protein [Dyadobacter]MDR6808438.1 hypothetical protein [Dyadobacter fermentans]MDR7045745.1 hypothetical protein [Dyadobacter sp. BE242]MDR7200058.1 hypothetical protein [Dyadobacter sp. BE34]MDR7218018.1 hypothetical protein [Dyadobacter sp. BE31]MDR7265949.1 hypothetical protein [Dyadobacter sp. BE32]
MEHSSVAFFQILYQNETLFQLEDRVLTERPATAAAEAPLAPPVPEPAHVQAPASSLPATPAVPIQPPSQPAIPAVPTNAPTLPQTPAVITPPPVNAPAPAPAAAFPALKHKVLVLTDEPKQQEMLMSEALFLDNILKAVGHSLETSDVLNFSFMPGQDARTVLAGKKTNFFISFGVPLIKLHLDLLLVPYTPKNLEGIWFLLVDPLVVIEADRNLKKKLWQALQKMFEMS